MIYKVISKLLANRLKLTLSDLIEPNQSAFIQDRLLLENVLLATELVKDYHKDSISPRCTIKFDISKAFDTVNWSFILQIFRALGFPDIFINWIHVCISTAYFSVVINGELEGFFGSSRGIRQGCSLSPYIFVLVQNVLSRLLTRAVSSGRVGRHPRCDRVCVSHLSFADDILVFTNGSPSSLHETMSIMAEFASISGLHINASKSALFIGGSNPQNLILAALNYGIPVEQLPIRYLGLPLTTKSMSAHDYNPLMDKIRSRFLSWTSKSLSYAGRLQLISSVITSISSFWCSVFRLPQRCFDEIEKMCCAFLWSGNPNTTTGVRVSWHDVCKPKSEGGLGLRKLRDVSRAFAFRLIWRLFSMAGSLWVAWTKQNLLKKCGFWSASSKTLGSWIWRKLLKLREEIRPFIRAKVNNGEMVSFWHDHWMPMGKLLAITGEAGPRILGIPIHATVKDALGPTGWRLRRTRIPHIALLITQLRELMPPNPNLGPDVFLWRHEDDDYKPYFSTYHTWQQIRQQSPMMDWSHAVWFNQGIPRFAFITWMSLRNRLPTGDRMHSWGFHQPCVLCGEREESRDHLFFACPFSFTLWSELAGKLLGQRADPDWHTTLESLTAGLGNRDNDILLRLCFQTSVYFIWRERNTRIHRGGYSSAPHLVKLIDKLIRNRIASLDYASRPRYKNLLQSWFAVSPLT